MIPRGNGVGGSTPPTSATKVVAGAWRGTCQPILNKFTAMRDALAPHFWRTKLITCIFCLLMWHSHGHADG